MATNETRSATVGMLLHLTPPLIQEDLLADREFRDSYGLSSAVILSVAGVELSVSRSELFDAIRAVLSGRTGVSVRDVRNRKWDVFSEPSADSMPTLGLALGERRLALPQYRLLSPDTSTRIRVLDGIAEGVGLPTHDRWLGVASERPLSDSEMDEFDDDVRDTPANVARLMRREIASGEFRVSSVVPNRRRYYARIVGRYDEAASISDHCSACVAEVLRDLCGWRRSDAAVGPLMLSCSRVAVSLIDMESLDSRYVTRLFAELDEHGDRYSQTGAVELALRILPKFPELKRHIVSMVRQIRDDDVDRIESDYQLTAGLFRLIDGELSRRRTLGLSRPYYRRFAALVQSTMAVREVRSSGRIDRSGFSEWLWRLPNMWFLLQNYVDMRLEPRWSPLLLDSRGMKLECIGRIVAAAYECAENIQSDEIGDVFLEGGDGSVLELFKSDVRCLAEYPGPLSATVDSSGRMPDEFRDDAGAESRCRCD